MSAIIQLLKAVKRSVELFYDRIRYAGIEIADHIARWHLKKWQPSKKEGSRGAVGAKRLLILELGIPEPDRDAGSRNILEFIVTLKREGWSIKFWPVNPPSEQRYIDLMLQHDVEILHSDGVLGLKGWLRQNGCSIDYVLICRPQVAVAHLGELKRYCPAPILYYGHDLHFARLRMQGEQNGDASLVRASYFFEAQERHVWRRSDVVLYPTQEEVEVVSALEPAVTALSVVIFCFDDFVRRTTKSAGQNILFVGGFRHAPNVDAVLWFARDVLPRIVVRCPDAKFVVLGSNVTEDIRKLAGPNVDIVGWATADELVVHYSAACAAVVPLRFGAGMKLKVVEALAMGVPLITTTTGAQGLPGLAAVSAVSDDPADIADAVVRALQAHSDAWVEITESQRAYAEDGFSRQNMRKTLLAAFDAAEKIIMERTAA